MAIENLGSGVYVVKNFKFVARGNNDDYDDDGECIPKKAIKASETKTVYEVHAYGNYENEGLYFTGEIVWQETGLEVSEAGGGMVFDRAIPTNAGGCKLVIAVDDD